VDGFRSAVGAAGPIDRLFDFWLRVCIRTGSEQASLRVRVLYYSN
jgi:hypothetical protein